MFALGSYYRHDPRFVFDPLGRAHTDRHEFGLEIGRA